MLAPIRDYLSPQDPRSSPLLCETRDHYFTRLTVELTPGKPEFEEARWIMLEDVNVEYLLDVFTSIDQAGSDDWNACSHFMKHLYWYKPRQTILGSKIETLANDHRSKLKCLYQLSRLIGKVGNRTEAKRLLLQTLELGRQREDDSQVVHTLRQLSTINQFLGFSKEGIQQAEEALEILERTNDTKMRAHCLDDLAWSLYHDNQFDAAENAASRAISLIQEKGREHLLCRLQRVLGLISQSKGEKEKAIEHFKTALEIASPFNWPDVLFWCHHDLARLFRDEGELDEANVHIKRAKPHAVNQPQCLGCAMYLQATVWRRQHRLEDAKTELLHALEIFETVGAAKDAENCRDLLEKVERTK